MSSRGADLGRSSLAVFAGNANPILAQEIANVLREQSKDMRLIRRQRAEEKAQKVPVKILFPVLFCIFPALLVVVIGPGMIRILSMFGSM